MAGWWFGTFFFPYIGNNNPNWRSHIFQRGGSTTNQVGLSPKMAERCSPHIFAVRPGFRDHPHWQEVLDGLHSMGRVPWWLDFGAGVVLEVETETQNCLVVSNIWIIFHFIYGIIPTPLTNSIIFQRGRYTTNQLWKLPIYNGFTYLRIVNPVVFLWHFQVANLQIVFHIWSQTRQGNWFRHRIGTGREVVWVPFWSFFFHLYPAWWLGTWILCFRYWECHHPNWRSHIFQRGRLNHQPVIICFIYVPIWDPRSHIFLRIIDRHNLWNHRIRRASQVWAQKL